MASLHSSSKDNKIQSVGLSDTLNLCGALEFAENLTKVGTQPIIGTQISFKYKEMIGLLPLFAINISPSFSFITIPSAFWRREHKLYTVALCIFLCDFFS